MSLNKQIISGIRNKPTDRRGNLLSRSVGPRNAIFAGLLQNRCCIPEYLAEEIKKQGLINIAREERIADDTFKIATITGADENDTLAIEKAVRDIYEITDPGSETRRKIEGKARKDAKKLKYKKHQIEAYVSRSIDLLCTKKADEFKEIKLSNGSSIEDYFEHGADIFDLATAPNEGIDNDFRKFMEEKTENRVDKNLSKKFVEPYLVKWGIEERVAADTMHVVRRLKNSSENAFNPTPDDIKNIRSRIADVYKLVSELSESQATAEKNIREKTKADIKIIADAKVAAGILTKEEAEKDVLTKFNNTINYVLNEELKQAIEPISGKTYKALYNDILDKFYKFELSNGSTFSDYREESIDVFGIHKSAGSARCLPKFLTNKISDNIKQTLQSAYFEEMCIQHDYKLVKTTGQEVLYRGIPRRNAEGYTYSDPYTQEGIAHCPPSTLFNTSIKTFWHPRGNNSSMTATTMYFPIGLSYAFQKHKGKFADSGEAHSYKKRAKYGRLISRRAFPERSAEIYVICPPEGQDAISLTHYNAYGSNYREIDFGGIPSAWIKERIIIKQIRHRHYRVTDVIPNEHFHSYLKNTDTNDTARPRTGTSEKLKSFKRRIGRSRDDSTIAIEEILKKGTEFESHSRPLRTTFNNFSYKINGLGKGSKIQKRYKVTVKDSTGNKIGEYIYRGTEQEKLYNENYNLSNHTSKKKKNRRYQNEEDFKARYTEETKQETRKKRYYENPTAQELLKIELGEMPARVVKKEPEAPKLPNKKSLKKMHSPAAKPMAVKPIAAKTFSGNHAATHSPSFITSAEPEKEETAGKKLWKVVHDILEKQHLESKFTGTKALIKELTTTDKNINIDLQKQGLGIILFGNNNFSTSQEKVISELLKSNIMDKSREILLDKVKEHNKDMNLERGIYGGLGGKGSMAYDDKGNVIGYRIDEIFKDGSFDKMRKNGFNIDIITEINGRNIAREGLSEEEIVTMLRGMPGEKVEIKFKDKDGNTKTHTVTKELHDATTHSSYKPLEKSAEKTSFSDIKTEHFNAIQKILHNGTSTRTNPSREA